MIIILILMIVFIRVMSPLPRILGICHILFQGLLGYEIVGGGWIITSLLLSLSFESLELAPTATPLELRMVGLESDAFGVQDLTEAKAEEIFK